MGKRGKGQKKDYKTPKRTARDDDVLLSDMDDEIDAFHKQRDVVPLDVNIGVGESDEEEELPVFDLKGVDGDEDDDDDDGDISDDTQETGFAAKIARQQKFLREKFGGVEDDMHEDEDEDEQEAIWGGKMNQYYSADNRDFERQSSDDEDLAIEEEEALKLQRQKAKSLSMEDFGLEDVNEDESDRELTLEEISTKGKNRKEAPVRKETIDDMGMAYEVKKDLNALSREEQMDVLYSSAPELVGLLSELNDALEQLESKVNPLLTKVKKGETLMEGGIRYLEVKQLLLLSYCQAITFYLLLKSEGQPIRDHPVLARLVEIKSLLDKIKQLDGNLPSELEKFLSNNQGVDVVVKLGEENTTDQDPHPSVETQEATMQLHDTNKSENVVYLKDKDNKAGKRKRQSEQVGGQSMEMLKVRAALEERLKQKGFLSSIVPKPNKAQKHLKPVNGQLVTYNDFVDDAIDVGSTRFVNDPASSLSSSKLSHIVAAKQNKPKVVSGDDDLPMRDDIGERRRKHELRVLAGAGIKSQDGFGNEVGNIDADEDADMEDGDADLEDGDAEMEDGDAGDSEDEYYKQVKQLRAAKLAAKAGFGCVYKGFIRSAEDPSTKIEVAVKQLGRRGIQGHKEWVTEVNVLGIVEHPNLVKLVGHCAEDDERGIQRLLVYEYMPNGSVEHHLSTRSETPLTWAMRLRIAQDAARGLTYLHEEMDFQIIFRDFKSSNVLLDEHWNAKLSDFGLARLGPPEGLTHVSTAVVGTMGYAAPEYVQTGRVTSKSDVWSYGVFLYELITGRRPLDRNRPRDEQKLLEWVKPFLSDTKKFHLILDPRLKGKYPLKSAQKLAIVANRCLVRHRKNRPKMSEVLERVNRIVETSMETGSPELPLMSLASEETSSDPKAKNKKRIMDLKSGESGWFARMWTPKPSQKC